jgi:hypothetical protein
MQLPNGFVNRFVVNIFKDYIFCSFSTRRSSRDYKVSDYGPLTPFISSHRHPDDSAPRVDGEWRISVFLRPTCVLPIAALLQC